MFYAGVDHVFVYHAYHPNEKEVQGLGFRVLGSGFRVQGLGFRV